MESLLSTKQVADRLGVDTKTVLRYLHNGKLKGTRIGRDYRIPESALNALLTKVEPSTQAQRSAIVSAIVNQKVESARRLPLLTWG
jgi:excisionase family DNA binding protein